MVQKLAVSPKCFINVTVLMCIPPNGSHFVEFMHDEPAAAPTVKGKVPPNVYGIYDIYEVNTLAIGVRSTGHPHTHPFRVKV